MKPRKRQSQSLYAVDDAWRVSIRAELDKRGMSQTDLAKAVGISRPMISQLLDENAKAKSSKHVPKIHAVLGLPPPAAVQAMSPLQYRWMQLFGQLDEETTRHLLELGERMAAKKP